MCIIILFYLFYLLFLFEPNSKAKITHEPKTFMTSVGKELSICVVKFWI